MAARGMNAHSTDTETAFLNADLHEEIFMRHPKGVVDGNAHVLRLLKRIYGLKQASREWYSLFHTTLTSRGLKRSASDTNMYSMNYSAHGICIFIVYVDIRAVSGSLD
jgi:hypothetical protein